MYAQALSVPEAVRQVLANNDAYLQALELGIANYTALAERMKGDVEKMTGSKVNLNTIVVAIKRLADTLERRDTETPSSPAAAASVTRAKMSLTDSIVDVNFEKGRGDMLIDMLEEFLGRESRHSLFQTDDNHFTLLAEDAQESRDIISNALEKFNGRVKRGLSKITITISPDGQGSPSSHQHQYHQNRLLSLVPSLLHNHQIPVHCSFFTSNEMMIILSDKDAARAYELIGKKLG